MRRRIERWALVAVLLALAALALRPRLGTARWHLQGALELASLSSSAAAGLVLPPRHIAHAGGAWRGQSYTNALEALEHNYALGTRWFEVDFLPDAQGRWWAVHSWEEASRRLGVPLDRDGRGLPDRQPPSGPFRLARIGEVLAWLERHPDARLVTDTKEDNALLLQRLESAGAAVRARIHPQIYRISEYPLAEARGFGAPIFTTYRSRYPFWVLRRFARAHRLLALTVTRDEAAEACRMLAAQVPLLTHTVNDAAEADRLGRAGIAGIYTDDLLP